VVQIATVIYQNGVETIERFNYELEQWMTKHEFNTLDDFRGSLSQANTTNPAGYMRVQFMKYFSHHDARV